MGAHQRRKGASGEREAADMLSELTGMMWRRTGIATDSLVCDACDRVIGLLTDHDDPDDVHLCAECVARAEEHERELEERWKAREGGR